MADTTTEFKFLATNEKGEVSALLLRLENAMHLLVPSPRASSNMRTPTMQNEYFELWQRLKMNFSGK